jgi:hypothetical protein
MNGFCQGFIKMVVREERLCYLHLITRSSPGISELKKLRPDFIV